MNREETLEILGTHEILPASKFGQNFLCDEDIISDITGLCGIMPGDKVIEIGPGIGSLTRELNRTGCDLTAVEIDLRLSEYLSQVKELKGVSIVSSDFLKYESDKDYDIAVSNIPYYVMTPIMMKLLTDCHSCRKMVFMVEDEAIRRINAPAGTKQYGPLSVMCSLYGTFKKEFTVPASSFVPPPHTTSAVITLTKSGDNVLSRELASFIELAFSQRRKKMVNSLSRVYDSGKVLSALGQYGISQDVRAESLPPQMFANIFSMMI